MTPLRDGDRVGDWVLTGRLGHGGMGTVYRAQNVLADRIQAALKVVHPDPSDDFRDRFIREVEALERLEHPAIVRVKGWGEDVERGLLWLAMDLVDGQDLAATLRHGALAEDRVRLLFAALAGGLEHAHTMGVFHRDIKPANVLVDGDRAKLVDFGIAMHDGRTRMSAAGLIPGTPAYLAPEVFGGACKPLALDAYAFGQMLCEALTGEHAFPEPAALTTTQRIAHIAGQKLRRPALDPGESHHPDLRELVRQTTQPDPFRRLTDFAVIRSTLEGAPLASESPSGTLVFDFDDLAPEEVVPSPQTAPVATERAPVPEPGGVRAGVVAFATLATLGLVAVLAGLGVLLLTSAEPVVVDVLADDPVAVWVDGERLRGNPVLLRPGRFTKPRWQVRVAAGPHCDLDGSATVCGACCACRTWTVRDDIVLSVAGPEDPTTVFVELQGAVSVDTQVEVDGRLLPRDKRGFGGPITPGSHTVRWSEHCPGPDCREETQPFEAVCHQEHRLAMFVTPAPAPEPTVDPPTPRPPQVLAGAVVNMPYLPGERAQALVVANRLERAGATVRLTPIPNEHFTMFGKIVPVAGHEGVADVLEGLVADRSYVARRTTITEASTDATVVFWFRALE